MFCPDCRAEYRQGFTVCADCEVALVVELPAEPRHDADLVKVFETGDPALLPILHTVLEEGGIRFLFKGEGLQDLFGWGRVGASYNYVVGPAELYVHRDDETLSRELLARLDSTPGPETDEPDDDLSS